MTDAIIIPLEVWQDPQGDVILVYSEWECSVYFSCWTTSGEPADFICQLSFQYAFAVRSFARKYLPYRIPQPSGHSFILRVPDSDLVREHITYRLHHYSDSPPQHSDLKHYVVVGGDIYHEILANGFTAATILKKDVTDPRLLRLIAAA